MTLQLTGTDKTSNGLDVGAFPPSAPTLLHLERGVAMPLQSTNFPPNGALLCSVQTGLSQWGVCNEKQSRFTKMVANE
jgi:hypothetical protein